MNSEKRTHLEQEANINQIEDKNDALTGAYAEKPLRDIAREKDLNITEEEKQTLDRVADKRADKAIAENKKRSEERMAENKDEKRLKFKRTDLEPKEEDWTVILEIAKDHVVYPILEALHNSNNAPMSKEQFEITNVTFPDFPRLNSIFLRRNLPYRLGFVGRSQKYNKQTEFKLFIVEEEK